MSTHWFAMEYIIFQVKPTCDWVSVTDIRAVATAPVYTTVYPIACTYIVEYCLPKGLVSSILSCGVVDASLQATHATHVSPETPSLPSETHVLSFHSSCLCSVSSRSTEPGPIVMLVLVKALCLVSRPRIVFVHRIINCMCCGKYFYLIHH